MNLIQTYLNLSPFCSSSNVGRNLQRRQRVNECTFWPNGCSPSTSPAHRCSNTRGGLGTNLGSGRRYDLSREQMKEASNCRESRPKGTLVMSKFLFKPYGIMPSAAEKSLFNSASFTCRTYFFKYGGQSTYFKLSTTANYWQSLVNPAQNEMFERFSSSGCD